MSSSKGHVVLPGEAIDEYGADTTRFFLLNSAEPWQDYDWREDLVGNTHDQLQRFWTRAQEVIETDVEDVVEITMALDEDDVEIDEDAHPELAHVDRWLLSKLQTTIEETTEALDRFETRSGSQAAFYQFEEHLKWYRRRADVEREGAKWTLREVLRTRLRLLAPFVPFMANELHEQLTGEPADDAAWPEVTAEFVSPVTEAREQLVSDVTDDVNDIVDVTGTDPNTVRVYAAADWKHTVFETVREVGTDVGAVMGEVMQDEQLREKGDAVNDLAQDLVEFVRERDEETLAALADLDERTVYEAAAEFFADTFDADVEVYEEGSEDVEDPDGKASQAVPFRPAIHLE
jgi:leucyl-tRNA synthetase